MKKNLYKILGVTKKATKEDIKKAYREKSKIHHPDKGGSEEEFNSISESYRVLVDDAKRKRYDDGESINQILKPSNDKSLSIIGDMVCGIIENTDPTGQNILTLLKQLINTNIQQIELKILQLEKDIEKYKSFSKKIKRKSKEDNFLIAVANSRIREKELVIEDGKRQLSDFQKAKEVLEDFDYDVDEFISIMGFTSFSTATSTGF